MRRPVQFQAEEEDLQVFDANFPHGAKQAFFEGALIRLVRRLKAGEARDVKRLSDDVVDEMIEEAAGQSK